MLSLARPAGLSVPVEVLLTSSCGTFQRPFGFWDRHSFRVRSIKSATSVAEEPEASCEPPGRSPSISIWVGMKFSSQTLTGDRLNAASLAANGSVIRLHVKAIIRRHDAGGLVPRI